MFKKLEIGTDLNDLTFEGLFYYPIKYDIVNTPSGQENSWGRLIILVLDDFLPQQFLLTFGCFYYRQKLKNQQWTPWINLSLGSEAYVLPEASETSLGGVKVGRGLNISDDGVLSADSFEIPIAKKDRIGGVKIGKNLEISEGGVLSASDICVASKEKLGGIIVGDNLEISEGGVLSAVIPEIPKPEQKIASKTEIGVIKIGDNLEVNEDGVLSVVLPRFLESEQKIASKTEIGGIKIGDNLEIDGDGTLSAKPFPEIPLSSRDNFGLVKVGDNLEIKDGILSVSFPDNKYDLPIASETQLGGIKIGDGIEISNEGKISVNIPEPKEYVLPKATEETLGGVKIGDGINFSDDGIISVEKYELPIASKSKIGGIKITSDFLISEDGSLSINKEKLPKQKKEPLIKKKEVTPTFEYEIQGRKYLFNYSLDDKINFANKANVCIMSQTGILAGASLSTVIEAIDIETKNKMKLILSSEEFLDLYINGALKLGK